MALILPRGPSWSRCTTNLAGSQAAAAYGTAVASGATANVDGSVVALLTNVPHDVERMWIGIANTQVTGGNTSALLDIMVDPAGGSTWTEAIGDLLCGFGVIMGGTAPVGITYEFPLWFKSGHSFGARLRTAHSAAVTARIIIIVWGGNANPGSWWCGQKVTSIGINAATSTGTSHTPGNTGVFSSWANLGSPLPAACGAINFAAQGPMSATANALSHYFEFGVGSTMIGAPVARTQTASEVGWMLSPGPTWASLPSGAQLMARGTSNSTAQATDLAAYAIH